MINRVYFIIEIINDKDTANSSGVFTRRGGGVSGLKHPKI